MHEHHLADCHTHSSFSPDGNDSVEAVCERAMDLGYGYIAITDHCECNDYEGAQFGYNYKQNTEASLKAIEAAAVKFEGRLSVLKGLELGQPLQGPDHAKDALKRDYDFVLGSVHNITGFEDFYFLDYDNVTNDYIDQLMKQYFSEVLETVRSAEIDSLAHLTYPLRYISGDNGFPVDLGTYHKELDEIYRALIKTETAMEVNTSGLRQNIAETLPDVPVLARYYELGGRLVTLGSDAHSASDIGKGIDQGIENLRLAGFKEYSVFLKRSPVMIEL